MKGVIDILIAALIISIIALIISGVSLTLTTKKN